MELRVMSAMPDQSYADPAEGSTEVVGLML
jgi:hypothetical protein